MTLDQWQSQADLISWARTEPIFRQICYIVQNELPKVVETVQGCSEARAFGRVEGFKLALGILKSLTVKPAKEAPPSEMDFTAPLEGALETPEVQD